MAMSKRTARILGAAAAGGAVLVTIKELQKVKRRREEERQEAIDAALVRNRDYGRILLAAVWFPWRRRPI